MWTFGGMGWKALLFSFNVIVSAPNIFLSTQGKAIDKREIPQ